ncbi:hypothetical protein WJX73_006592 [Symbiochloris irregularis]|uniref:FAS1 domain-containing protein n=1 Tax=Symbiochloris irregularis TaxID=706552 RepID=A0AAW1P7Z5_9CHLO
MKAAVFACALLATCAVSVYGQSADAPAPTPCLSVAQLAQQASLNQLLQAVEIAGLTTTLSDPSLAVTVFAPTDEAFNALLDELTLTSLDQVAANNELSPVLDYHILTTPLDATQLLAASIEPTSYLNETLTFTPYVADNGDSTVAITSYYNNATVTSANNVACNSIVHVIDNVLIPQFFLPDAPGEAPSAQAL